MAPQIIILVIFLINLLLSAYLHGKPKEGKHNFWINIVGWGIQLALLWWGGFFDVFCK